MKKYLFPFISFCFLSMSLLAGEDYSDSTALKEKQRLNIEYWQNRSPNEKNREWIKKAFEWSYKEQWQSAYAALDSAIQTDIIFLLKDQLLTRQHTFNSEMRDSIVYAAKDNIQRKFGNKQILHVTGSERKNYLIVYYFNLYDIDYLEAHEDSFSLSIPLRAMIFDVDSNEIVYNCETQKHYYHDDFDFSDTNEVLYNDDDEWLDFYSLDGDELFMPHVVLNLKTRDTRKNDRAIWYWYSSGGIDYDEPKYVTLHDYQVYLAGNDSLWVNVTPPRPEIEPSKSKPLQSFLFHTSLGFHSNVEHTGFLFKEFNSYTYDLGFNFTWLEGKHGFIYWGLAGRFQNLSFHGSTGLYEGEDIIKHRFRILTAQAIGGMQWIFGKQKRGFVSLQFQENFNAIAKYTFREEPEVKQIITQNLFLNRLNHEVKAMVGVHGVGFYSTYRLNSMFKDPTVYGDLSPFSFGIEIYFNPVSLGQ